MRPTLVQEIKDPDGRTAEELDPEEQSEVISEESAAQLAEMMTSVADEGTAVGALGRPAAPSPARPAPRRSTSRRASTRPGSSASPRSTTRRSRSRSTVERCTGCFGGDTAGPIATAVMRTCSTADEAVVPKRSSTAATGSSSGSAPAGWPTSGAPHDTELGRDVAIKVLHENFARDTEFVERFRREASSAAGLQHQNVVSVYDRGEWEGTYYIAMELVEGSSLRDLINRGLEPGEAIEVARQVLAAAELRARARDRPPRPEADERADRPRRAGSASPTSASPGPATRRSPRPAR